MSDDGTRIIGYTPTTSSSGFFEAFLWESATDTRRLADVLADDHGLVLGPLEGLTAAGAISGDGQKILGVGTDPAGNSGQVFLITLGTP